MCIYYYISTHICFVLLEYNCCSDGQRKSSWKRKPTSATSDEDMGFGSFDYNELADAAALQRLTACAAQPNSDLQYSSATVSAY